MKDEQKAAQLQSGTKNTLGPGGPGFPGGRGPGLLGRGPGGEFFRLARLLNRSGARV